MDREGAIKLPYPRLVEIWKANMKSYELIAPGMPQTAADIDLH